MSNRIPKREFKRGSWDLRKEDRRKVQVNIDFPDRRKESRRAEFGLLDALNYEPVPNLSGLSG